ncbi:MAG: hypothetical protein ABJD97_14255 [Betaproteobacteria bacterium]
MKRKYLLAVTVAAALWSVAAMALPSSADVQSAVKAGDYPKAESMMQEVVTAKPQSAKAHYIYAEILAHDAKFSEAAVQARKAREIDPEIGFTDPDKFRAFERTLNREQAAPVTATQAAPTHQAPVQAASSGMPGWVWGLGFAVVAFLIWRMVSRRSTAMAPAGAGGYGMQPGAPQPGYGPGYGGGGGFAPGYGQAPGGGLLRAGLAAAGGVAAGMLVEKMIEGNRHGDNAGNGSQGGTFDGGSNQAATELENRPIDFGSGNDWGGGSGGGGGSDNFTPSGGGDDGGW